MGFLWRRYVEVLEKSGLIYAHCNETLDEHGENCISQLKNLKEYLGNLPILECFGGRKDNLTLLDDLTYFHDLGKADTEFQKNLIKNCSGDKVNLPPHAEKGFLRISKYLFNKCKKDSRNEMLIRGFLLSTIVDRHHSNLKDVDDYEHCSEEFGKYYPKAIEYLKERYPGLTLYFLYRLFYSCLKTADMLATSFGGSTESLEKTSIVGKINKYKDRLTEYIEALKSENKPLTGYRETLRREAIERVRTILEEAPPKRILFLYLPTGGGKTLTSLSMALELAEKKNLKRIFYVFPYINIIEQNSQILQKIFGDDLKAIHTYADIAEGDLGEAEEGINNKQLLNIETFNFPAITMSSVRFFDILFSNKKSSVIKTWALANSVVIIDEVQYFPKKYWEVIITTMAEFGELFNTYFILMSATLPQLDIFLKDKEKEYVAKVIKREDIQKEILQKFENRTQIKSLETSESSVEDTICEKAKELAESNQKVLVVVNTIRASKKIYEMLGEELENIEVCLLNSSLLYPRRLEVLETFGKNCGKKILVSTQAIEAGVDLDFDVGIREKAPPESILQVAGRINREIKRDTSVLYVTKKSQSIRKVYKEYDEYERWGVSINLDELNIGDGIDRYLKKLAEELRKKGTSSPKMMEDMRGLRFEEVGRERIIEKTGMIDVLFNGEVKIKDEYIIGKHRVCVGKKVKKILERTGWEVCEFQQNYCILNPQKFAEYYWEYAEGINNLDYKGKFEKLVEIRELNYIWRLFNFSLRYPTEEKLAMLKRDKYGKMWVSSPYYSFKDGFTGDGLVDEYIWG
ncbi:MAG: CRISPR-associated helicase Cas3' [Candidatus Micrarchaeia archaeon]